MGSFVLKAGSAGCSKNSMAPAPPRLSIKWLASSRAPSTSSETSCRYPVSLANDDMTHRCYTVHLAAQKGELPYCPPHGTYSFGVQRWPMKPANVVGISIPEPKTRMSLVSEITQDSWPASDVIYIYYIILYYIILYYIILYYIILYYIILYYIYIYILNIYIY